MLQKQGQGENAAKHKAQAARASQVSTQASTHRQESQSILCLAREWDQCKREHLINRPNLATLSLHIRFQVLFVAGIFLQLGWLEHV